MPETEAQTPTALIKAGIIQAKKKRDESINGWKRNVDYRRGQPFDSESDVDRIAVNLDWSLTKSKQAQLFSQVPQAILTPKNPSFAIPVTAFGKLVNDTVVTAKVGTAMDECLPDCINAAGHGAVIVSFESLTEKVMVPTVTPEQAAALTETGQEVPTEEIDRPTDTAFRVRHIAPERLLYPEDFVGSDFDDAYWLGYSGTMKKIEGANVFGLTVEQLEQATTDAIAANRLNGSTTPIDNNDSMDFDEAFYKRYAFHKDEKSFKTLHRLVFIAGIEKAVIDEPWKGQKLDPQTGKYLGACKFPIRVLTLTHISGQAIPPSDSAIGRPQVDELIKARTHMTLQRDRSLPLRWVNTDRVDPAILDQIMKGTWNGIIPMQGNGAQAIGEVARAMYPREDFDFDTVAKEDLQNMWSLGPNQSGNFASGERSAAEAQIVQSSFQTEMGYQRARTSAFFVGIVEVLAGLLALYGDFELPVIGEDGAERLQPFKHINHEAVFSILADSTVLLDSNQRMAKMMDLFNKTAPSGFINVEYLLKEIYTLAGVDPDIAVKAPEPTKDPPPNISYRFSGADDLMNPISLAVLIKHGQAPSPEDMKAAKAMLAQSMMQIEEEAPVPPSLEGEIPPPAGPNEPPVGATPSWETAPRVDRRSSDE